MAQDDVVMVKNPIFFIVNAFFHSATPSSPPISGSQRWVWESSTAFPVPSGGWSCDCAGQIKRIFLVGDTNRICFNMYHIPSYPRSWKWNPRIYIVDMCIRKCVCIHIDVCIYAQHGACAQALMTQASPYQGFCMAHGSDIKNKCQTSRLHVCEILGKDGASSYEKGRCDVAPVEGVKFSKVGAI